MHPFCKSILVLTFLLMTAGHGLAQNGHTQYDFKYYAVFYTLGKGWDHNKPAGEQEYFKEHSVHLSALRKERRITLGARYSDTGLVVFRAGTEEEVRGWVEADPAIQNKLFKVEVFEMSPFYSGCLE
jgi:hypothetical protein